MSYEFVISWWVMTWCFIMIDVLSVSLYTVVHRMLLSKDLWFLSRKVAVRNQRYDQRRSLLSSVRKWSWDCQGYDYLLCSFDECWSLYNEIFTFVLSVMWWWWLGPKKLWLALHVHFDLCCIEVCLFSQASLTVFYYTMSVNIVSLAQSCPI